MNIAFNKATPWLTAYSVRQKNAQPDIYLQSQKPNALLKRAVERARSFAKAAALPTGFEGSSRRIRSRYRLYGGPNLHIARPFRLRSSTHTFPLPHNENAAKNTAAQSAVCLRLERETV
jgi:hypothetical protein